MALNFGVDENETIFTHSKDYEQGVQVRKENVGTREIWFQMQGAGQTSVSEGSFIVYQANANGGSVQASLKTPDDFSVIEKLSIVVIPEVTKVNFPIDFDLAIAGIGQLRTNLLISNSGQIFNLVEDRLAEIDITNLVNKFLKSGDYIGVDITNVDLNDDLGVMGIILKYK